jgi:hypothetical protein
MFFTSFLPVLRQLGVFSAETEEIFPLWLYYSIRGVTKVLQKEKCRKIFGIF